MTSGEGWNTDTGQAESLKRTPNLRLALALGAVAVVGAGVAFQQFLQRRLTKPEKARLRFYKYLRERGRLES